VQGALPRPRWSFGHSSSLPLRVCPARSRMAQPTRARLVALVTRTHPMDLFAILWNPVDSNILWGGGAAILLMNADGILRIDLTSGEASVPSAVASLAFLGSLHATTDSQVDVGNSGMTLSAMTCP